MKHLVIAALALGLIFCSAADGLAHSRKGLVKTTLYSDALTVDQIAYYLEAKVNTRADDEGRKYRYTLWEFERIERQGDLALVHVQINDQKTDSRSPDILYLKRNADGSWNHVDAGGAVITAGIYTMVKPDYSLYYLGGGALVLCALLAFLIVKRKRGRAAESV